MNRKPLSIKTTVLFVSGHFLIEMWRAFMDFGLVIPEFTNGNPAMMYLFAAVYTSIFTVWLIGLVYGSQGSRIGIVTALVSSIFFLLVIDVSTFLFYCPGGCPEPIFNVTTGAGLIFGTIGVVGLLMNLRKVQAEGQLAS